MLVLVVSFPQALAEGAEVEGNTLDGTVDSASTFVGDQAFRGCTSLESASIPSTLNEIKAFTFADCPSLVYVGMKEGLTRVGSYAFYGCSSLPSVDIPTSVDWIGGEAFAYCSSLRSAVIPEGVGEIIGLTFVDCTSLVAVTIPSSVTTIGSRAFQGCTSLRSVVIPEGIESMVRGFCQSDEFENVCKLYGLTSGMR